VYRRFGEVDAAGTSPLYQRVAVALSESSEALRAIGDAVEMMPEAVARVPADALPVITTTWALSRFRPQHHRPGGVRPVGSACRGHWPLLVAGPLPRVADRLLGLRPG
jgi:hypothetical protein